jgi:hypothetical protein
MAAHLYAVPDPDRTFLNRAVATWPHTGGKAPVRFERRGAVHLREVPANSAIYPNPSWEAPSGRVLVVSVGMAWVQIDCPTGSARRSPGKLGLGGLRKGGGGSWPVDNPCVPLEPVTKAEAEAPAPAGSPISWRPGAPGRPARSAGRPRRRPGSARASGHAARTRRRSSCRWPRRPPAAAW